MSRFDCAITEGLAAIACAAASPVTYRRGANHATVKAIVGQSRHQVTDAAGGTVMFVTRDYLIDSANLPFGEPLKGDIIEENDGHTVYQYAATRPDGEPVWKYSDNARSRVRLFTQLDSQGAA